MLPYFWLSLLIKIGSTAAIVVAASLVAQVSGPFWGALVACLPVSSGPAYVFLALDHDAAFIAASALASCAGCAAVAVFLAVYARLATAARPLWQALGAALLAWAAAALLILALAPGVTATIVLNLVAFASCHRLMPPKVGVAAGLSGRPRWYELPLRGLAVGLLVAGVVSASGALGPQATGIASLFPISLTSVLTILHLRAGGGLAAATAMNAMGPMVGFAVMLLGLSLSAPRLGAFGALGIAMAIVIAWSCGLVALRHWRGRRIRHQVLDSRPA